MLPIQWGTIYEHLNFLSALHSKPVKLKYPPSGPLEVLFASTSKTKQNKKKESGVSTDFYDVIVSDKVSPWIQLFLSSLLPLEPWTMTSSLTSRKSGDTRHTRLFVPDVTFLTTADLLKLH